MKTSHTNRHVCDVQKQLNDTNIETFVFYAHGFKTYAVHYDALPVF